VRTKAGGIKSLPGKRALRSAEEIRGAAYEALAAQRSFSGSYFGDDNIAVSIEHNVAADTVTVEVWSVGPKPKGKTGRGRDVDNFASTILDALNGLAYDDDRGVSSLQVKRV